MYKRRIVRRILCNERRLLRIGWRRTLRVRRWYFFARNAEGR